uniref:WHIM1 domain-containing protein n=1 Tax=Globodera pallida TaxID=36090 RepID=A0A183CMX9_GLOPA
MELSEAIERCRVDDVFLCEGPRPPQKGSLGLIGHHLIFSPAPLSPCLPAMDSGDGSPSAATAADAGGCGTDQHEFWLLHRAIDRVIVEPISRDPNLRQQGAFLRLKCKNFMHLCFELNALADCQAVARSIEKLSNLHPQLQQQQSMNDLPTMDDDDDLPDENSPETGQSEPALSNLSASHVLRLIALFLDYLLQCVHEDGGLDPKFSDEQMHLRPLCVDPSGRKFWHFNNDTWLFMEEGSPGWMDEEKTQKEAHIDAKKESKSTTTKKKRERHIRTIYDKRKRKKGKKEQKKATEEQEQYTKRNRRNDQKRMEEEEKNITRQEVDEACKNLFTGMHL